MLVKCRSQYERDLLLGNGDSRRDIVVSAGRNGNGATVAAVGSNAGIHRDYAV